MPAEKKTEATRKRSTTLAIPDNVEDEIREVANALELPIATVRRIALAPVCGALSDSIGKVRQRVGAYFAQIAGK